MATKASSDPATALAEHVAGSEEAFVAMMNARAAELGMADTHFTNCTGLDDLPEAETHRSTAYDIALMSRELLRHEAIRRFTTIWMDTVRQGEFGLTNTNKLVRFYEGTTGLKTVYTSAAGHCLSASAERDGTEYLAVVLHCSSSGERFQSARTLLDYGFANFALARPDPAAVIPPVPVLLGEQEQVHPVPAEERPVLVEKGRLNRVTTEVRVDESVRAPVEAGQRLGTMTLSAEGEVLAELPLVAPEEIPARTWQSLTEELLRVLLHCAE